MKRVLLALVLVGCGSSSKKPEAPPTPTERQQPPAAPVATNEPTAQPEVAPTPPSGKVTVEDLELPAKPASTRRVTQAQLAWELTQDGIAHVKQGNYEEATEKFRDAVARMPEPAYFFNLCVSLYQEGRFNEALIACNAVERNSPTPKLETKAKNWSARVVTEAGRQGIKLE